MVTAAPTQQRSLRLAPLPGPRPRASWMAAWLSLPGVLWVSLWFGINTGPWVLDGHPRTLVEEIHYARTLFPLFALGIAVLLLLGRAAPAPRGVRPLPAVLWPWVIYGFIALLACATAARPAYATYWALCYLAAFAVLWAFVQAPTREEHLERCRQLNHLTWVVAVVLLLALMYIARDMLFVADYRGELTGYGVVNRVGPTAGVGMARASGFARLAAIPAVFAFVLAWRSSGLLRGLWAAVALGGGAVVYLMQSRGAILGLAAALAFAMLFMGRRSRTVGVLALLLVAVALVTDAQFTARSEEVMRHVSRERAGQDYSVTSGRTRDWAVAWAKISESPLWGWGPQADRSLLHAHVHNSYLYAWLSAGLFGCLSFAAGLLWSWMLLLRSIRDRGAEVSSQRTTLVQVGCLLAFFTVRGVPEVSGAMFGVDLLLLLPAIGWLGALHAPIPRSAEGGLA